MPSPAAKAVPETRPLRDFDTEGGLTLARRNIQPSPSATRELTTINASALMKHIQFLGRDVGPHPVGSRAGTTAIAYIEAQFRSYGYQTRRQSFRTQQHGLPTANVLAYLPSRGGRNTLLVGAHHDTTPTSPGADDNSTGVAVMLEVARVLARGQSPFDVTFVAFGAEELNHDGSKFYVSQAKRTGTLPQGMINLDMVAVGQKFQIGCYNTSPWLMNHWVGMARGIPNLEPDADFGGKSDYASFAAAGVPVAACAWDPEDPYKHSPNDSLPHLTAKGLMPSFKRNMTVTANSLLRALLTPFSRSGENAEVEANSGSRGSPQSAVVARPVNVADRTPQSNASATVKPLSSKDLAGKSNWELDVMRNSYFALHGKKFQRKDLQEYFEKQPWYRVQPSFRETMLSPVELRNVELIRQHQQGGKAR